MIIPADLISELLLATVLYNFPAKGIWELKIVKITDFDAWASVSAGHKTLVGIIRCYLQFLSFLLNLIFFEYIPRHSQFYKDFLELLH